MSSAKRNLQSGRPLMDTDESGMSVSSAFLQHQAVILRSLVTIRVNIMSDSLDGKRPPNNWWDLAESYIPKC